MVGILAVINILLECFSVCKEALHLLPPSHQLSVLLIGAGSPGPRLTTTHTPERHLGTTTFCVGETVRVWVRACVCV